MGKSPELKRALKHAEPEVVAYISALESENANLHRRAAKMETKNLSDKNRIAALERELEQRPPTYSQVLDQLAEERKKTSGGD